MKLVLIHEGTFQMGSASGEKDELPIHSVTISKPFCLGDTEVTRAQWKQVLGPNTLKDSGEKDGKDDLPVTWVSYEDVQGFISKLNQLDAPNFYRLPTEAEWEYAAALNPSGGNCRGGGEDDHFDELSPVRSFPPNGRGLHDMLGNAWEWVEDWYGPYPAGPMTDPHGPATGEQRVRRGGAYDSAAKHCRVARRETLKPGSRFQNTGFRVLRELE